MIELTNRRAWVFASLFILSLAGFLSTWSVVRTDTLLRADLLRRAWFMAQALNVSRLYSVIGAKSDIDPPHYLRLKKQLVDVMHIYQEVDQVFLLCRQPTGQFCLVLDSKPLDSKRSFSLKGDREYTEQALQRVLVDHRLYLEGFVTRYKRGKVTAFVPVNDPKTGKMVAVLGMDVCIRPWRYQLLQSCLPAMLLSLLLTGILLIGKRLVRWRTSRDTHAYSWMPFIEPCMVFAIGIVLTAFSVRCVYEHGKEDHAEKFSQLAAKLTAKITEKIATLRDFELEGVAKFYECSGYVSDCEFADYIGHLTQDIAVELWAWIVAVPASDRDRFERETVKMKGTEFVIWEAGKNDERLPVLERDAYYPIYQIAPLQGNELSIGYDFGANPEARNVLEVAAHSKLTTSTDALALIHHEKKAKGIYVYRAVFEKKPPQKVQGYVVARVRLDALLTTAEPGSEARLCISLVDANGLLEMIAETQKTVLPVGRSLMHIRPYFAFGKTFEISAKATDHFCSRLPLYAVWWTAFMGFLLTGGICSLQLLVRQRRRELQALVEERTYSLRKSEEHLAATLRSIDDGVIVCDVHGRVTSLNGVAEKLTGWTSTDASGRYLKEVFHIVDARTGCSIPNLVERVLKEGKSGELTGDTLLISRTLYEYSISSSCTRVRDHVGGIFGAVLVFRDETAHKRNEKIVRANAERLQDTLELARMTSAPLREIASFALEKALVLTHSKIGYLAFLNDAEDELTLYVWSQSVMEECTIEEKTLIYPVAAMGLWGESIRQRKTLITNNYAAENPLKKGMPAGHVKLNRHISVPIFFDGKIVILVGAGNKDTDYTEDDANQLSLFMHGFWNIVKRKHMEDALKGAKEEAETAMHIKTDFLANMSHEIRTPINAVIGMSELLKRTDLTEIQQKYLQRINSSSQLLLQIINDILDLSKMEADRLTLDFHPFALCGVIDSLKAMFSMSAGTKGIDLRFNISPVVPKVLVTDSLRLSQVLTNLLSNAIKFTGEGYVELNISLVRCPSQEEPSYRIRFEVRDTGIGLSEEHVKDLFQAFMQADVSTTRKYGGTGLGLAISKKLVELLGGSIAVDSTRGKGSTFYFELELEAREDACIVLHDTATDLSAVQREKQIHPDFKKYKVLIVEDNMVNQEVLVGLLEVTGIAIIIAENGRVALETLKEHTFDIILMDLQMPEMDGFEAIQRIRDSGSDVPIVALSAAVMESDRLKAAKAGSNDFITKPIDFSLLLTSMKRLLGYDPAAVSPAETQGRQPWSMVVPLAGFEMQQGLEQVNNMQDLYRDVLASFLNELKGLFADLPEALAREMTEETRRKVHTLKGLAATVGATRLARVATVVNAALKGKQVIPVDLLDSLRDALSEAREGLEAFFHSKDTGR